MFPYNGGCLLQNNKRRSNTTMKIELKQGKKFYGDKLVCITAKDEPMTIVKLVELINILTINEVKRLDALYPQRTRELLNKFLLETAILKYGLGLGKQKILFRDWLGEIKNQHNFVKTLWLQKREANIIEEILAGIEFKGDFNE